LKNFFQNHFKTTNFASQTQIRFKMKSILTLILCLVFSVNLKAQFLKLQDKQSNAEITGQSNLLFFANTQNSFDFSAKIKNISSVSQNIKVRRIYQERLSGSRDFFCWDLCFDSLVSNSGIIPIAAGTADSTSFHATYYSGGNNGVSKIKYLFFSADNVNDTASFVLHFSSTPTGIIESNTNKQIGSVGPIPADEQISVFINRASNNTFVQLVDFSGRIVSNEQVGDSGPFTLNTTQINAGIYLLQVVENNVIADQVKVVFK
jgi:hypothetical protein